MKKVLYRDGKPAAGLKSARPKGFSRIFSAHVRQHQQLTSQKSSEIFNLTVHAEAILRQQSSIVLKFRASLLNSPLTAGFFLEVKDPLGIENTLKRG